jgi:hypothetical protein
MDNNLKALFVSFVGGTQNYYEAGNRIKKQALDLNLFDKILILDPPTLNLYSSDYSQLETIKSMELRSYFHASKAWVLREALRETFGKFDVVMYADVGCELLTNIFTRKRLRNMLINSKFKGGLAEQTHVPEREWTKIELINYLNAPEKDTLSGQIQATWSILNFSEKNLKFSEEWCFLLNPQLELMQKTIFDERKQFLGFKEHRVDQSVFSLLWKKYELPTQALRSEWSFKLGPIRRASNPIQTIRNRSGESQIIFYQNKNLLALLAIVINFFLKFLLFYKFKKFLLKGIN